MAKHKNSKLRIIGGQWRRQFVEFPQEDAIRPTPDRVRETLFNWLQGDIHGAICLEPFAGSGILSLEALPRGAKASTILDQSQQAIRTIQENLGKLGAPQDSACCVCTDARRWLAQNGLTQNGLVQDANPGFDLIFLDPPFADGDIEQLIENCARLLNPDGLIYVETPQAIDSDKNRGELTLQKQKKAGMVHYALLAKG